jgi:hypothetical protein
VHGRSASGPGELLLARTVRACGSIATVAVVIVVGVVVGVVIIDDDAVGASASSSRVSTLDFRAIDAAAESVFFGCGVSGLAAGAVQGGSSGRPAQGKPRPAPRYGSARITPPLDFVSVLYFNPFISFSLCMHAGTVAAGVD